MNCKAETVEGRVRALETVITPGLTPLRPITRVPAVTRSSSASVRDNCPAVSVPRLMATPAVLLRSVIVPVEETTVVVSKFMESAVRVIAAPEELVVMVAVAVAADVLSSIPVLLAPTPPVPVTETVPVPPALILPPVKI